MAGDWPIAIGLAALLCAAWAARDWADLATLHLPDTDDAMRLQQIRDWMAGQGFGDMAQHRLGAAPGLIMHWSRLADLAPATLITVLRPLIGMHAAELAMVIIWPALLLAGALMLIGAIARRVDPAGEPRTTILVAALAYPATTIFAPGRIDHHGLQIVLLLVMVRAVLARPGAAAGAIAAIASALSLMIGLETAPLLLIGAGVLAVHWLRAAPGSDRALLGFGVTLAVTLALGAAVLGGSGWHYPACDGFTASAWRAAEAGSMAPILAALGGRIATRFPARAILLAGALALAAPVAGPALARCAQPYGAVDPELARLWLGQVGEAQPLFGAPLPIAIGYAGVMSAGIAATAWRIARGSSPAWHVLFAFQLAAFLLACVQLRGAYAGAILAAPALAAAIGVARTRGALALAAAWTLSAGMLYPIAAQALTPDAAPQGPLQASEAGCTDRALIDRLRDLRPGIVMAPIDAGAYLIAASHHRAIAAPYHRNNAGNAAMYRFFASDAETARRIAAAWRVDYVLICDPAPPGAFAAALERGDAPAWLHSAGPKLWRTH